MYHLKQRRWRRNVKRIRRPLAQKICLPVRALVCRVAERRILKVTLKKQTCYGIIRSLRTGGLDVISRSDFHCRSFLIINNKTHPIIFFCMARVLQPCRDDFTMEIYLTDSWDSISKSLWYHLTFNKSL